LLHDINELSFWKVYRHLHLANKLQSLQLGALPAVQPRTTQKHLGRQCAVAARQAARWLRLLREQCHRCPLQAPMTPL